MLKEIRAIVRPNRLAALRDALRAVPDFPGLTILSAEGFTAPAAVGKRTVREELTDYTSKVAVSVLAPEHAVERIIETIASACSTGQIGDGLIWVVPVERAIRVRDRSPL